MNQTIELNYFLEIKSNGEVNFAITNSEKKNKNYFLFSNNEHIFNSFSNKNLNLSRKEFEHFAIFIGESYQNFVTLYPQLKGKSKKINLLVPFELINFSNIKHEIYIDQNENGQIVLSEDNLKKHFKNFEINQKRSSKENGQLLISCTNYLKVVDGKNTTKSLKKNQVLKNPVINFYYELQTVNLNNFKEIFEILQSNDFVISRINCSEGILDQQVSYLTNDVLINVGKNQTFIKKINENNIFDYVVLEFGFDDFIAQIVNDLNLNWIHDAKKVMNIVKNYFGFDSQGSFNLVMRHKSTQKNLIQSYSLTEINRVIVKNFNDYLEKINLKLNNLLGNFNSKKIHFFGLEEKINKAEKFLKNKYGFNLIANYQEKPMGIYSKKMLGIINWSFILQQKTKIDDQKITNVPTINDTTYYNLSLMSKNQLAANERISYFRSNNVIVETIEEKK